MKINLNNSKLSKKHLNVSEIISSIKTPLGFFSLVVLISEIILASVTVTITNDTHKLYLIIGMLIILFSTVIIVGIITYRNNSLMKKEDEHKLRENFQELKCFPKN